MTNNKVVSVTVIKNFVSKYCCVIKFSLREVPRLFGLCATRHRYLGLLQPIPLIYLRYLVPMATCRPDVCHPAACSKLTGCLTASIWAQLPSWGCHSCNDDAGAAPVTEQTIRSSSIHCFSSWAGMQFTGLASKSVSNRNADSFVQRPHCGNWRVERTTLNDLIINWSSFGNHYAFI